HGDRLVVDPALVGRQHARPRPAAASLHLAALHGERDIVAAGIAGHDLELGAEHAVDDARELVGVGGLAGAADDQFLRHDVFQLGDAARLPGDADADLVVGAADPGELVGLELRALGAEQRIEGGAAAEGGDRRAVLRADIVDPVGKPQAAGAFHVLRDDGRVAGDVLAQMAGKHAGIEIVGAADAVADIELDVAALVELRGRLREGERYRRKYENGGRNGARPGVMTHHALLKSPLGLLTSARAHSPARSPPGRTSPNPSP